MSFLQQGNKKENSSLFAEINSFATAVGWSVIAIAVVVFLSARCTPGKPKPPEEPKRPEKVVEPWHKAESKAEVAARILARLEKELSEIGIDGSEVIRNAKEHPLSLVSRVPEHDRTRLLVLSREDERKIAQNYVAECRKNGRFADRPGDLERIRRLVSRIVAVIPEIGSEPDVYILTDDTVNACCLPDGTVLVNTGLLEKMPEDDLLAAVLSHELGHAAARHGTEGLSRLLALAAGGVVFEEWAAGLLSALDSGKGVSLVRLAYGIGTDVGIRLPRKRRQENEADRLGVRYLARAGFDPASMARLFERFEQLSPEDRQAFDRLFSTHPMHADRIAHVRDVLLEPDLRDAPPSRHEWSETAGRMAGTVTNLAGRIPPGAVTNLASRIPLGHATNLPLRFPRIPFGAGGMKPTPSPDTSTSSAP